MARLTLVLLTFAFSASTAYALSSVGRHYGGHDKLARAHYSGNLTERGGISQKDWKLSKRFDGARCTNYQAGVGACGATNSDNDFIVALNAEQYGNGEYCFETITITYNGKSAQAQITDECMGCPYGGLDLTTGLFEYFASLDEGVIYATWSFDSGSSQSSSSSSTPAPKTTSTQQKTTSSSTWTSSTTSSSSTSTWSSSSSSSTSTSSTFTSSSTTPSSSVASATPSLDTSNTLQVFDYGVIQLGGLISAAAQVNLQTSDSS